MDFPKSSARNERNFLLDPFFFSSQEISDKKSDVINVWKNYTKVKGGDQQRRVENSSWRLWFKQRIEAERLKVAIQKELQAIPARANGLSKDSRIHPAVLNGNGPLSPGVVVENALNLLTSTVSSTVDYFSVPLQLVSGWPGSPSAGTIGAGTETPTTSNTATTASTPTGHIDPSQHLEFSTLNSRFELESSGLHRRHKSQKSTESLRERNELEEPAESMQAAASSQ
jgi:hypothetical protein